MHYNIYNFIFKIMILYIENETIESLHWYNKLITKNALHRVGIHIPGVQSS